MVSTLRRRVAAAVLAGGLLVGAAFPGVALAQREAIDFNMVCVYYTETAGSCVSTTHYSDGGIEHRWYVFWGNWYAEV
jgi:hypothetical protein